MSGKTPIIISGRTGRGGGPRIPGVFPSSRFGEQVVSTGIPSLDSYIGGGIPLGSVCILRDTFPSRYADLVLKCFIAEGATYNHHIYIAANNKVTSKTFSEELPGLKRSSATTNLDDDNNKQLTDTTGLKIAWRYGVTSNNTIKGQKEAKFEFKKKTTVSELGCKNLTTCPLFENEQLEPINSNQLLKDIANVIKPFEIVEFTNVNSSSSRTSIPIRKPVTNLIRIAVSHCEEQVLDPNFMMRLRALVRHTNSCAVLTVSSSNNINSNSLIQCERMADYLIRFETILDDTRKLELGDVDGLIEVVSMISINSIKPNEPPRDLGFSFRNKRLTFQELHIPPEGENTVQRETSSSSKSASIVPTSCGVTVKGKSIDF